ncbi:hypothetical protein RhiJN_23530 [Ceratobasidium sp. AG-Ba]|nr:hypothetical protein RhiJN_23530 [Ceratobasidium sp. AG-Ba]
MSLHSKSILRITEIASIISGFLDRRDAARLGRTNHRFFEIAMPVAWKHVHGAVQIFKLVKGCNISKSTSEVDDESDDEAHEVTCINLPSSIEEEDLSRLKIYGPLVKSLEVFGNPGNELHYAVFNASALLSYTEHNQLLPNLQRLNMTAKTSLRVAYYFWFRVFASRSTLQVCPVPSPPYHSLPYFPLHIASSLIKDALGKCLRLDTIGLFVLDDSLSSFDHPLEHLAFDGTEQPLAPVLAEAKTLVNVSGSSMLLEGDIFSSLGKLPNLTRLEVFYSHDLDDEEDASSEIAEEVEEGAFPQLRYFALYSATQMNVESVWQISNFFPRLTTLVVELNFRVTPSGESWVQDTFIPLLCKGSPQLIHLTIRFQITREELSKSLFIFRLTKDNLVALAALPLTTLILTKTRFDCDDPVKAAVLAWPAIEIFKLPSQTVDFEELFHFAMHMPRLRDLNIEINMASLPETLDLGRLNQSRHPALQWLDSGFNDLHKLESEQVRVLYRFLKTLFPNTRFIGHTLNFPDLLMPRQKDYVSIRLLNEVGVLGCAGGPSSTAGLIADVDKAIYSIWNERDRIFSFSETGLLVGKLMEEDPKVASLMETMIS